MLISPAMPAASSSSRVPNTLEALWMPFTANRDFKKRPRLVTRAKDMYYYTETGESILDGAAGLWCCNAGHNRSAIMEAIQHQLGELDFVPNFQFGHPLAFQLANKLTELAPDNLDHVFFTNSGSESVDTALKIALAYYHVKGEGGRQRFISRERSYHGVGFGGIAVGGLAYNRKQFGGSFLNVDFLSHTYSREHQAFTGGEPEWGGHLAQELERLVTLHDASTIAGVIVEPMAGSTGVLPPPKNYLQQLRKICDAHKLLLIFDEVITGFGRLGYAFAAERYGVVPDMIIFAKGVTSGAMPLGGVLVSRPIYEAFMEGPEYKVEFSHGYTYSAHPLACAAALAALDLYKREKLFERALKLESVWREALLQLKGLPHVLDVRAVGLAGAIDLEPIPQKSGLRGYEALEKAFRDQQLALRSTGDTLALTPSLIITEEQIHTIASKLAALMKSL